MDNKFNSILTVTILPYTISLIAKHEKFDDITAINKFYYSKTYEMLTNEKTKMWHFSPMTIYTIWKHEQETGELIFPEE